MEKVLVELFSASNFSSELNKLDDIFIKVAKLYETNFRHRYSEISKYVYDQIEMEPDAISYILNNIMVLQMLVKNNASKYEELLNKNGIKIKCTDVSNSLAKLYDHISLEEERIINNDKIIRNSNLKIQNDLVISFNAMAREITDKFNDMSNTQNANIMTIIGLFSAIIFVFFGGITGLSSIIKGIFDISKKDDLIFPLIIILFIGLVLFDIVFMLLYSVAKILDKNIGRRINCGMSHYYHREKNDDCFYVKNEFNSVVFCTQNAKQAERVCFRKNCLARILYGIKHIIKIIFFRYPLVSLFNFLSILGIAVLYFKI